jgi:hypothetical protein
MAGLAWAARTAALAVLCLIGAWVHVHLGGVALRPSALKDGANDTGRLFNWHPIVRQGACGAGAERAPLAGHVSSPSVACTTYEPLAPAAHDPGLRGLHE